MIDSESGERGIRIPARGKGVTELPAANPRCRRVIYEGGKPYPREDFDWNVCLSGLIAPADEKKAPGDRRGTEGYKTPPPER